MGQGQYGPAYLIGADWCRVRCHVDHRREGVSRSWAESVRELRRDRAALGFGALDQFDTRALDRGRVVPGRPRRPRSPGRTRRPANTRGTRPPACRDTGPCRPIRRRNRPATEPGDRERCRRLEHVERARGRFVEAEGHPDRVAEVGDAHQPTTAFGRIVGEPQAHLAHLAVGLGDPRLDRREPLGLPARPGRWIGRRIGGRRSRACPPPRPPAPTRRARRPPGRDHSNTPPARPPATATTATRRTVEGPVIEWRASRSAARRPG